MYKTEKIWAKLEQKYCNYRKFTFILFPLMVLILFIFVQNSHTAYFMNGRSSVCKNHRTCALKYVLTPFCGPVTSRPKMDQLCRAILMKFERANFEGLYLRFRANFWDAVKRSVFLTPRTFIYSKILSSFHMVNLTFNLIFEHFSPLRSWLLSKMNDLLSVIL